MLQRYYRAVGLWCLITWLFGLGRGMSALHWAPYRGEKLVTWGSSQRQVWAELSTCDLTPWRPVNAKLEPTLHVMWNHIKKKIMVSSMFILQLLIYMKLPTGTELRGWRVTQRGTGAAIISVHNLKTHLYLVTVTYSRSHTCPLMSMTPCVVHMFGCMFTLEVPDWSRRAGPLGWHVAQLQSSCR